MRCTAGDTVVWTDEAKDPTSPNSEPDLNPGRAPRGAARGTLPSIREPRDLPEKRFTSRKRPHFQDMRQKGLPPHLRKPGAEASASLLWDSAPPSPRSVQNGTRLARHLPSAPPSPLLIHEQPGLHGAKCTPGTRGHGAICRTRLLATVPACTLTLIVGVRFDSACAGEAEPCLLPGSCPAVQTGVPELLTI